MTILAVVAHPDDEVLGVGGTLARHAADGERVEVLILADGATSRAAAGRREVAGRESAAQKAAKALGIRAPRFGHLPDQRLDGIELLDVVKLVEAAIASAKPTVVYTHCARDLNLDHRIVHQAVVTACRPLPSSRIGAIYAFETPSSTEWTPPATALPFAPVHFVDISRTLRAKRAALKAYAGELRPFPHPRSIEAIEALARWRGASSGFRAAEAFEVVRQCVR